MEKYVIVHGSFGSPFINWFSWLHNSLAGNEVMVVAPQFPVGLGLQNYDNWSKLLDYYYDLNYIDGETTLIGHSIAAIFIVKYLILKNIKVKKLVFVAGFNNYLVGDKDYDVVNESFFMEDISSIKNLADDIVCFYSDNDPYVKYEVLKEFVDNISTKNVEITGGGHLNSEAGYNSFEELLEEIKK